MLENNVDSSNKKRGLGRGLGSLLGGTPESRPQENTTVATTPEISKKAPVSPGPVSSLGQTPEVALITVAAAPAVTPTKAEDRIWKIGIDKLTPGHYQPRQDFPKESLQELAQSIRSNGILQPIVARKKGDQFEIIAGERRWRASQMAGLHEVPVIIREFKDQEALELALVENIQREDLNPVEEAEAYQRLIQEFHMSQQQVAEKVGKERATVANSVRLLSLPGDILRMISQNELSVGHAKVLLSSADSHRQIQLAKQVLKEKLSVRKLEKLMSGPKEAGGSSASAPADDNVMGRLIHGISEELQKMLGTKVAIDYTQGKGKISIQFYSDDEFSQMVERLKKI